MVPGDFLKVLEDMETLRIFNSANLVKRWKKGTVKVFRKINWEEKPTIFKNKNWEVLNEIENKNW